MKMKKIQKYEYKCEAIALNMKKMGRVLLGMIDTVCENVVYFLVENHEKENCRTRAAVIQS